MNPQMRAHIRQSPELADLAQDEADAKINDAVREIWQERMTEGDFVGAYHWDEIYNEVSFGFGGTPVPDVASVVRACCDLEGMIALLPGAKEGLSLLHEQGFRLVAATNGYYAYQWPVLKALDIASLFETILTPDRVGYAKPDPRFFGSVPGLAAHVGDTLLHDVLGANAAGLVSVWLDPDLPDAVKAMPIRERTGAQALKDYLQAALDQAPYRSFHPEATPESCHPGEVVIDAYEAGTVLAERF